MRGTLSAWFLHGVCQHVETRRHDVSRLRFGINARVGGKSVASRAEMQMQYGQYGRGDTVSFVGSRLSPPRVSVTRLPGRGARRRRAGRAARLTYQIDLDRAPAGMRLSCSRLLGTFRTSSSGIARPIMNMTSTWKMEPTHTTNENYGIICTAYAYFRFSLRSESRVDSSVAAGSVGHHA
jgi:hypothetical protein